MIEETGINAASGFDEEADLYDMMRSPQSKIDVPFFQQAVKQTGGPVLELACGTGRILLPCAMIAKEAVGVDLAPKMLAIARRRAATHGFTPAAVQLVEGDIRNVRLNRVFPLVLMGGQPLCFLPTEDDVRDTLVTVRAHLAPDGRWVAAVPVPRWDELILRSSRPPAIAEGRHPRTGQRLAIHDETVCDEIRRLVVRTRIIETLDDEGKVVRVQRITQHLYFRDPSRLREMITDSGFRILELYGGYARNPFTDRSPVMIWMAGLAP
ncbi:class I SAM-dependent DNA methyltransferase [Microbispora sp. H10670]|uniref:class I SAM-dependent DNA methyltransferase n=1 Tax=Microbispora sp. H10670 TaxID=2729108 RepID=UPI00160336B9|nr:class I SAM-dependent methyltransferase [Microbispora sp. H10670]